MKKATAVAVDEMLKKFSRLINTASFNGFSAYANLDEVNALIRTFNASARNKQASSVRVAVFALVATYASGWATKKAA